MNAPPQGALTDAEWREFQSIPDQGYSHRAWIDARIAERVAENSAPIDPGAPDRSGKYDGWEPWEDATWD